MIKKLLLFLSIAFSQILFAQNEFITVWKPSNASTNISGSTISTSNQIWFPGTGTNFNITWEENSFPTHNGALSNITATDKFLIDFGAPLNINPNDATYKVKISNGSGSFQKVSFPAFYFISPSLHIPNVQTYNGDVLKIIEISQWGNINWTTLEASFAKCENLNITATDVPNLSNVTSTSMMFYECFSLIGNASFNNWDTSNVTNMSHMFASAGNFNQPLGNWNTSNVTNMTWMFHYLPEFNQSLQNWNVSNVATMDHMFHICTDFNQPLNNWNVSNVTNMNSMLEDASTFNQTLESWNLNALTTASQILQNSGLSCDNYNTTLIGWSTNSNTPNNISLGGINPLQYSTAAASNARNNLLTIKNWNFTGDIFNPECVQLLSTNELNTNIDFSVYPNPATDFIYVKNYKEAESYMIFDVLGRIVLQANLNQEKIDIKSLEKGNYILQLKTKNNIKTFKIIKK